MSGVKRLMEHQEEQRNTALRIAVQAGALKICGYHGDCVFDGGSDPQGAYKLGNFRFSAGELEGTFESRTEMCDTIKSVIEEHWAIDKCPRCEKMLED